MPAGSAALWPSPYVSRANSLRIDRAPNRGRPFTRRRSIAGDLCRPSVIAIENARLFQELKESLEQQTATSEILGVIAARRRISSPCWTLSRRVRRGCVVQWMRRSFGVNGTCFGWQPAWRHSRLQPDENRPIVRVRRPAEPCRPEGIDIHDMTTLEARRNSKCGGRVWAWYWACGAI